MRSSDKLTGEDQCGRVQKSHHCTYTHIRYVIHVAERISEVITFFKSLWLMAQNLKEVFSSYIVWRSLKDSEDGEITPFPPRLGSQLSLFNMVAKQVSEAHTSAKLVNEISMDIVMPEEISIRST